MHTEVEMGSKVQTYFRLNQEKKNYTVIMAVIMNFCLKTNL